MLNISAVKESIYHAESRLYLQSVLLVVMLDTKIRCPIRYYIEINLRNEIISIWLVPIMYK